MSRCVLVGPPGAGKTTVGRELARKLGCEFFDSDLFIIAKEGKTIGQIFAKNSEAGFREMELAAIEQGLECPGVVSVGGGAVTNKAVRDLMADQTVVWLKVTPAAALARLGDSNDRPLLQNNPNRIKEIISSREPIYAEVASFAIDTTGKAVHQVVDEIAQYLMGRQ